LVNFALEFMQSTADAPEGYINSIPEVRKQVMTELRNVIIKNLPEGFEEVMSYGMISYVVPHSLYEDGYHCNPKQPLPFMSIASQKSFVAVYHMGIYADKDLLDWLVEEYERCSTTKLDMGKSCIRFKKPDAIPMDLLGELASKLTPKEWIAIYERTIKSNYRKTGLNSWKRK
jgi:hypothetical protein